VINYIADQNFATVSQIPEPTVIPPDLLTFDDNLDFDDGKGGTRLEIHANTDMKFWVSGNTNTITISNYDTTLQIRPDGAYINYVKVNPIIDINVPIYENNQQTGYFTKNAVSGEAVQAHVENEIWNMTRNTDILDALRENLPIYEIDNEIIEDSNNPVSGGAVYTYTETNFAKKSDIPEQIIKNDRILKGNGTSNWEITADASINGKCVFIEFILESKIDGSQVAEIGELHPLMPKPIRTVMGTMAFGASQITDDNVPIPVFLGANGKFNMYVRSGMNFVVGSTLYGQISYISA
jgi:hypothetical protein